MQLRRRTDPRYSGRRRLVQAAVVAVIAGFGVVGLTGLALASSPATLSVASGVKVKNRVDSLVVDSKGITVYTLSGETVHHLKCTKANTCLSFWFPVKTSAPARRLTAAHGIKGRLGILKRDGFRQVTLGGHPLYTFIGDAGKKGKTTGEGLTSFHGTWHVIAISSASSSSVPAPTTTTTTTSYPTSTTSTATSTTPYYP